jgi:hypothetical protein
MGKIKIKKAELSSDNNKWDDITESFKKYYKENKDKKQQINLPQNFDDLFKKKTIVFDDIFDVKKELKLKIKYKVIETEETKKVVFNENNKNNIFPVFEESSSEEESSEKSSSEEEDEDDDEKKIKWHYDKNMFQGNFFI